MKSSLTYTFLILATSSLAFSQTLDKARFNDPTDTDLPNATTTATGRIESQNVNFTLTTTDNGTSTTFAPTSGADAQPRVVTAQAPYTAINNNPAQFPNIGPVNPVDRALFRLSPYFYNNQTATFTLTITFDKPVEDLYMFIADIDGGIWTFQNTIPTLVSAQNPELSYDPNTGVLRDTNPDNTGSTGAAAGAVVARDAFGTFHFDSPVSQISVSIVDNPNSASVQEDFRFGFAVPEPSSAILALLGSSLALLRRRR